MTEAFRQFADNHIQCVDSKALSVARIQLIRSVKSSVTAASTVNFEIILSSEFFDTIPKLVESVELFAAFIPVPIERSATLSMKLKEARAFPCNLRSTMTGLSRFPLTFPAALGAYQLFLFSNQKASHPSESNKDSGIIILPLLTSRFNVVSGEEMTFKSHVMPLLVSFRFIDGIIIEEEYGKMLGSHIYDSSIIILRYLTANLASLLTNDAAKSSAVCVSDIDIALELGAGCGLVSIWLSKQQYFCRVISTDMELQLPLINRNIKRNAVHGVCTCRALDWCHFSENGNDGCKVQLAERRCNLEEGISSKKELLADTNSVAVEDLMHRQLQRKHLNVAKNEYLKMIIAGDVLYSLQLAEDFFSVVRALAEPNFTIILVAQKLRNLNLVETVDVTSIPGFSSEIVWQEANVTIWKLLFIV